MPGRISGFQLDSCSQAPEADLASRQRDSGDRRMPTPQVCIDARCLKQFVGVEAAFECYLGCALTGFFTSRSPLNSPPHSLLATYRLLADST